MILTTKRQTTEKITNRRENVCNVNIKFLVQNVLRTTYKTTICNLVIEKNFSSSDIPTPSEKERYQLLRELEFSVL